MRLTSSINISTGSLYSGRRSTSSSSSSSSFSISVASLSVVLSLSVSISLCVRSGSDSKGLSSLFTGFFTLTFPVFVFVSGYSASWNTAARSLKRCA
ncbi:uncharacterized protein BDV14DRAFT_174369 [Aspergillus stella-maris]|uniref:uncharacterized protein n=1 Tax=Aspergillus stella-maris TaxID=1810926 RepID=UPI003CCD6082